MTAIINGKRITAKTLTQIKRLASIEANKNYKTYDEFYLLSAPGFPPVLFTRYNKKYPNNTIIRGEWH